MTSSAKKPLFNLHLPAPLATTSAPPPTPSSHSADITTPDHLSHLFQRLTPTLSPPTRRTSATITPPLISISDITSSILSASTHHGFFHLTHHNPIPSSAAESLFNLPQEQKQLTFPNIWPRGYDDHDDDDDVSTGQSFCFDPVSFSGNGLPGMDSLVAFGREMEKLGWDLVEKLASFVGFKNPDRDELYSLMWISDRVEHPGRVYPYVIGLHCQVGLKSGNYTLLSDSGWVNVSNQDDSMLVTVGDIAQVWSNGKLKKVRGRPVPTIKDSKNKSGCITLSLLITLSNESTISPRLLHFDSGCVEDQENAENDGSSGTIREQNQFQSFSFEDYAWRVYHERVLLKDPLVRYRI